MAELYDIIELIVEIPERNLHIGDQGTIVLCHTPNDFEIEFSNELGETLELLTLNTNQFIVVWQAETRQWISVGERTAALIDRLPDDAAQEVLDFARFLSVRRHKLESAEALAK